MSLLTPTSSARNTAIRGSQSPSPNHRLLFVEDDPSTQAKLTRMVGRIGRDWEVDCVTSGEEALAAIERQDPYDLILADYFLDGAMTGADFATKYAARTGSASTIVLTSATSASELGPVVYQYPFLAKPYNEIELEAVLELHKPKARAKNWFNAIGDWLSRIAAEASEGLESASVRVGTRREQIEDWFSVVFSAVVLIWVMNYLYFNAQKLPFQVPPAIKGKTIEPVPDFEKGKTWGNQYLGSPAFGTAVNATIQGGLTPIIKDPMFTVNHINQARALQRNLFAPKDVRNEHFSENFLFKTR